MMLCLTLTPGSTFAGANSNCVVDVTGGVTVRPFEITHGYSKSLILTNPLTVSDDYNSRLDSEGGAIRGSAIGEPAARGTLNIMNKYKFYFAAGDIESTTVNLIDQSTTVVNTALSVSRNITGSDIYVNEGRKLDWGAGNVNVTSPNGNSAPYANSNIFINSGGTFAISAAGGIWGMNTPSSPAYFKVVNNGTVQLNATGTAAIVGDYFTTSITRLNSGILHIDGLAEQTGGVFSLRGNTTVQVGTAGGNTLGIRGGSIEGQGTVEANLVLGYDTATYNGAQAGGVISPGYIPPPGTPGGPGTETIGTITVTGAFQMFAGGMSIDVTAGGSYDKVVVQGSAWITGALGVGNYDHYQPAVGTSLAFLTAASITGDFTSVTYTSDCWFDPTFENVLFRSTRKNGALYVYFVDSTPMV